jgi:hypothetical protein
MAGKIVSFFDQFPEYNGKKIEIRGTDGYVSVSDISAAIGKRFRNWTRTQFAKDVLEELSIRTRQPIALEDTASEIPHSKLSGVSQKPLIDGPSGERIFVHPSVAFGYAMSDAKFFARISLWVTQHQTIGTVNPHVLDWTREEYERGLAFNRDDIKDMYYR